MFNIQTCADVEAIVDSVFADIRPDLITVTTCADTVRVERKNMPFGYIQTSNSLSLWRVIYQGDYVCGMETVHDAFRVLLLMNEREKKCK